MYTAAVEQSVLVIKESYREGTPDTVAAVYCHCTDRIIYFQFILNKVYCHADKHTCDCSDNKSSDCIYVRASGCDCHKACQRTV